MKHRRRVHVLPFLVLTAAATLLAVALASSVHVGSAARIEVRAAAPLQVFLHDVEPPDPEPPAERTITVIARRFNTGNDQEVGGSPTRAAFEVRHGQAYTLTWTGGSVVACASVGHPVPPGHVEGMDEAYRATADTTHELCTQTGNGEIGIITSPSEAP